MNGIDCRLATRPIPNIRKQRKHTTPTEVRLSVNPRTQPKSERRSKPQLLRFRDFHQCVYLCGSVLRSFSVRREIAAASTALPQLRAKVVEDYPGEPPRQPHGSARHAMRARVAEFYSVNARSPPSSDTAARASPQRERRRLSALDQFIPKVRGPDRRTRRARARQKMSTQIGRQGVQ